MGLFEKIFGGRKPRQPPAGSWETFTAYNPVFTSWQGELYEQELVRDAIHARALHISKLKVEVQGAAQPKLQTQIRHAPNPWQSWAQFLYRVSTILDVQNNVFIVPLLDAYTDTMTGFYPCMPTQCEVLEYNGEPWLQYRFGNGRQAVIEMSRCAILNKFQYKDDVFGEKNTSLTPTLDLIEIQNQGIVEGVKNSARFRFMARMNNFALDEDLQKEQKRFSKAAFQNEDGGVLLFPNTYTDIKELVSKPYIVDTAQMEQIQQNVYSHFGVNSDILQNKAYGTMYQGVVEPFAIQISDALSRMAFTQIERARGSQIIATANQLQYMSAQERREMAESAGDRGLMTIDEIRTSILGLPPLPDGMGNKVLARGEYYELQAGDKSKLAAENEEGGEDDGDGTQTGGAEGS